MGPGKRGPWPDAPGRCPERPNRCLFSGNCLSGRVGIEGDVHKCGARIGLRSLLHGGRSGSSGRNTGNGDIAHGIIAAGNHAGNRSAQSRVQRRIGVAHGGTVLPIIIAAVIVHSVEGSRLAAGDRQLSAAVNAQGSAGQELQGVRDREASAVLHNNIHVVDGAGHVFRGQVDPAKNGIEDDGQGACGNIAVQSHIGGVLHHDAGVRAGHPEQAARIAGGAQNHGRFICLDFAPQEGVDHIVVAIHTGAVLVHGPGGDVIHVIQVEGEHAAVDAAGGRAAAPVVDLEQLVDIGAALGGDSATA